MCIYIYTYKYIHIPPRTIRLFWLINITEFCLSLHIGFVPNLSLFQMRTKSHPTNKMEDPRTWNRILLSTWYVLCPAVGFFRGFSL